MVYDGLSADVMPWTPTRDVFIKRSTTAAINSIGRRYPRPFTGCLISTTNGSQYDWPQ